MEFFAFHGHFSEEQLTGNRFIVDLEFEAATEKAGRSDVLTDAADYQIAYRIVSAEMQVKSKLIENVASRILDALHREMPEIGKATVSIRKMNPPMGGKIGSVSVTMSK